MHRRAVVSQVHRMGRVENPKTLKALPLMEVRELTRSPDTNRSPEIYLTLGRYRGISLQPTLHDLLINSGVRGAS
jgi:hypothetical protein